MRINHLLFQHQGKKKKFILYSFYYRVGIWSFDNGGSSFTDINITFCGEIPKNLTNQTNLANQSETISNTFFEL